LKTRAQDDKIKDKTAVDNCNFESVPNSCDENIYELQIILKAKNKGSGTRAESTHFNMYFNETKMRESSIARWWEKVDQNTQNADYQKRQSFKAKCGMKACNDILEDIRFAADLAMPVDDKEFSYYVEYKVIDNTKGNSLDTFLEVQLAIEGKGKSSGSSYEAKGWVKYVIWGVAGVAGLAVFMCVGCIVKKVVGATHRKTKTKAKEDIYMVAL